ncbi:MAG: FAD-dependent oxidoreductase, partial [Firmicutes bacterium]|nr:FAD-dependent oxidoreductase [Bacillota bacterium]
MVATDAEEEPRLEALASNAAENGVTGLRLLTSREVAALEPRVRARLGLLVPDTGIVDVHRLMELYLWLARERGAELVCRTEVVGLEFTGAGYLVWVRDREGTYPFRSRAVVNSAGLWSDRVAAMAGLDVDRLGYRLHYCKGHYFSVCPAKGRLVSRLVYPVPHPQVTGLGIHVTLDLGGRMRLGPDTLYVREPEYGVDEGRRHLFWEGARRFLPDLEPADLSPDMAGVRPKLQGPGQEPRDFVVRHE